MKKALILSLVSFVITPLFSQSFLDVTSSSGLNLNNIMVVAVFDYNNDDYQDVAINYYNGSERVYTLMKNNGDKTFTDVGSSVGFPNNEFLVLDYDNDGYSDLVVIDTLNFRIYRNEQGSFVDYSAELGIINPFFATGETSTIVNAFTQIHDYDGDGDLDFIFVRYEGTDASLSAVVNDYHSSKFFEKAYIIPALPSNGIQYTLFDMDNDFDMDVVGMKSGSQFSLTTMHLWENDNGTFTDVTSGSGLVNCYPRNLLAVDFNDDGYIDILKGGADGGGGNDYRVFLNDGDGTFTDASSSYAIRDGGRYYGNPAYIDFDNDSDNDVHWGGIASTSDGRLRIYQNDGNLNFNEVSTTYNIQLGSTIGGVPIAGSTPSVFFDYDNDGDLDVFISDFRFFEPFGGIGYMMENQIGGNFLKLKVNGCSTNRDGKGVKISATIGGNLKVLYNSQGVNNIGYNKSNVFHFGLGENTIVDELSVNWQNGGTTTLTDVSANQTIEINETDDCPIWYGCTVFDTIQIYDTTYVTINDTVTVMDTTFVTVYDTITVYDSISVTDTLIIDAVLTGINPPDNINTIKVYPNPAKDHVFINTGDYIRMNGYRLVIINNSGVTVFETLVAEPLYEVNLSDWSGYGLYFLQVIDSGGSIIDIRKIILN